MPGRVSPAGPVNLSVGYRDDKDMSERMGGTVGGSVASISWKVGADTGTDSCGPNCDDDRFGFHVGYAVGSGNAYVQFSDLDSDQDMNDTNGWVFGYSPCARGQRRGLRRARHDGLHGRDGRRGEGDHDSRGLEGRLLTLLTENVPGLATKMWIDCGAPSEAPRLFSDTGSRAASWSGAADVKSSGYRIGVDFPPRRRRMRSNVSRGSRRCLTPTAHSTGYWRHSR